MPGFEMQRIGGVMYTAFRKMLSNGRTREQGDSHCANDRK